MREFKLLYALVLILVSISVSACGEDDITNPENAQWSVVIAKINDLADAPYSVSVNWIGDSNRYDQPYKVDLRVGDEPVPLNNWNTYWIGEAALEPGHYYTVELSIDDMQMCKTSLFIVNDATASFPSDYDPSSTSYLSWSVNGSNQTQRISVVSFNNSDNTLDDFEEIIPSSARSFYLPANIVQSYGSLTTYTLEITQLNTKTVNDVLLISSQSQFRDYGFGAQASLGQHSMAEYCLSLARRFR